MKFDWLLRFRFNRWTFLCGTCYTQLKWVFIHFNLLRYVLSWPWIHFFWHLQPVIMDLNSLFCAIMYNHIWTWYGNLDSIYIALKRTSIRCKNPFFIDPGPLLSQKVPWGSGTSALRWSLLHREEHNESPRMLVQNY